MKAIDLKKLSKLIKKVGSYKPKEPPKKPPKKPAKQPSKRELEEVYVFDGKKIKVDD